MKKIFISQPMKGKTDEEILNERRNMVNAVKEKYGNEVEILQSFLANYYDNAISFLGKSIEILSNADIAVFGKGWDKARGCIIEHQVCKSYGVPTLEL